MLREALVRLRRLVKSSERKVERKWKDRRLTAPVVTKQQRLWLMVEEDEGSGEGGLCRGGGKGCRNGCQQ